MSRPLAGRAFWLATAASVALLPGTLAAQETPQTPGSTWLGRLTYFTTRLPRPVLEVPASVTVVDGEQIEAQNVTDMQQLVRYVPGVSANRQVGAAQPFGDLGGFSVRGVEGNRVMMLIDGARVPERITDGSRDYMDMSFVRQAEIIRGPSSVLWGADALGGVVALRTITAEDVLQGRSRGGTFRLGYDSFNQDTTGTITLAQRLNENLSFVIGVSRQQNAEAELSNAAEVNEESGIACTRNLSWGATPCDELNPLDNSATRGIARLHWTPLEGHELTFSFDRLHRDTRINNNFALGPNASGSQIIHSDLRERTTSRNRYAFEHLWTPQGGLVDEVRTTLSYSTNSMDIDWYQRIDARTSTSPLTYQQRWVHNQSYLSEDFLELDIQANRSFSTGAIDHELTFGFDGDRADTDYQRITYTTDLATGDTTRVGGGGFNFANVTTTRADVYIQNRMTWGGGRFELTPGLRYATYDMEPRADADYVPVPGQEPQTRSARETLLSLGARWQINDTWSVWANAGEGFKMPTAQQLFLSNPAFGLIPAPDLQPEYVTSYEIGTRAVFDRGYLSVSAYNARYDNFILGLQPVVIEGTTYYTSRNVSERETWGVEVSGEYELRPELTLNGSLAWQQGRDRASAGAAQTWANLPPLTGTLGVSWEVPRYDLTLDLVSRFASGVNRTTSATGFRPGGYAAFDVYGQWAITPSASLNFGVVNIFDRTYFESSAIGISPGVASPLGMLTGPGRTFNVSLNTRF